MKKSELWYLVLWVWSLSFAVLQICVRTVDTRMYTQISFSVFTTLGTAVLPSLHFGVVVLS